MRFERITFDPRVIGGKPCIRGGRVPGVMIVGIVATGHAKEEILRLYASPEPEDIDQALSQTDARAKV
ncbi:MAG: DUF433 domain-containing protein [Thermodesulfobacteriota bacterium]